MEKNTRQTVARLLDIAGSERVNQDKDFCALYSEDIAGVAPLAADAVVRPADATMLQAIVRWAADCGTALVARGGGMSYSGGYLPQQAAAVLLDMRDLNALRNIDTANETVSVEAGCTWAKLYQALADQGLRTPFFGPLSGVSATVGGTAAQNGAFFGSAAHGVFSDQLLGLELVDGRGERRYFGQMAADPAAPAGLSTPRRYGPDLHKLLVADAGAFGIKTAVTLPTMPMPTAVQFLSYAFQRSADVLAAIDELGAIPQLAEVYAFDRETHRNLARGGFSVLEAASTAGDLLAQSQSVLRTAGRLLSAARLQTVKLNELNWSLHLVVESAVDELAQAARQAAEHICRQRGGEPIPDTIPRVTRARPFRPIKALIGPDGERWLPCHGVFAAPAAGAALQQLEQWLAASEVPRRRYGIRVSTLLARAGRALIVEPQFFWPDSLSAFQQAWAQPPQVQAFAGRPANPQARAEVLRLRAEICRYFGELGAGHLQLGKYYPWLSTLSSGEAALVRALKKELDPRHIFNPGALGL